MREHISVVVEESGDNGRAMPSSDHMVDNCTSSKNSHGLVRGENLARILEMWGGGAFHTIFIKKNLFFFCHHYCAAAY